MKAQGKIPNWLMTLPQGFREQGNKEEIKLERREQRLCFSYFSEHLGGNTNIEKILLGNNGTQRKFCWEEGNMDPAPTREALVNLNDEITAKVIRTLAFQR